MDYNGITRVVIKSAGLLFVLYAILILAANIFNIAQFAQNSGNVPFSYFGYFISTGVYFLSGLLLWLFPKPIANTIVQGYSDQNLDHLEDIAFRLIGLVLLVLAVSKLVREFMYYQEVVELMKTQVSKSTSSSKAQISGAITQAVLSLFLVLRGPGIAKFIRRLRYARKS